MPIPRRFLTPRPRRRGTGGPLSLSVLALVLVGFFLLWAVLSLVLWLVLPAR